jgi:uncharacterized damage-inducible protein DinB
MLRTKWLDRKFNFDLPAGLLLPLLARLAGTLPRLEYIVHGIPEDKLEEKQNDKWSIKEHIGHLAATESLHTGRIDDIAAHREELRPAAFKKIPDYNRTGIRDLLLSFDINRQRFISQFRELSDELQNTSAMHPRLKVKMRPIDIAYFAAEHDDHHIASILECLKDEKRL